MYSYRAHVYDLYAAALAKATASATAYAEVLRHQVEVGSAEFEEACSEFERRFAELETEVKALTQALPHGVSARTELPRHMWFCRHWIARGQPTGCGTDPSSIVERDLPAVIRAFGQWYEAQSQIDASYAKRLHSFNSVSHINSAAREAWAIFKTRTTEAYDLPGDLDGHQLVDRLFGDDDPAVSSLSDRERRGYHNLFKGLYTLYRNPVAHNDQEPNPAEADALIALIGICLSQTTPPDPDANW